MKLPRPKQAGSECTADKWPRQMQNSSQKTGKNLDLTVPKLNEEEFVVEGKVFVVAKDQLVKRWFGR